MLVSGNIRIEILDGRSGSQLSRSWGVLSQVKARVPAASLSGAPIVRQMLAAGLRA